MLDNTWNAGTGVGKALAALVGLVGLAGAAGGCARQLTITQDDYVNNAMQIDRRPEDRTGEPLEVNIVCVYPDDLSDPRNERLRGTSAITSDEWFARRPVPGDQADLGGPTGRFRLLEEQIFLLTNERYFYGQRIGAALRGAKQDGRTLVKGGIEFNPYVLHSGSAVIYVFGRFTDKEGKVLAVPPAVFHPPGAFGNKLAVKIGIRDSGPHFGQYVEIDAERCPRKMHGGQ